MGVASPYSKRSVPKYDSHVFFDPVENQSGRNTCWYYGFRDSILDQNEYYVFLISARNI